MHIGACNQVALLVESHTIGTSCSLQKQRYLAGIVAPLVNSVIGLVGKIYVTVLVYCGAFRKFKSGGQCVQYTMLAGRYQVIRIVKCGGIVVIFFLAIECNGIFLSPDLTLLAGERKKA